MIALRMHLLLKCWQKLPSSPCPNAFSAAKLSKNLTIHEYRDKFTLESTMIQGRREYLETEHVSVVNSNQQYRTNCIQSSNHVLDLGRTSHTFSLPTNEACLQRIFMFPSQLPLYF